MNIVSTISQKVDTVLNRISGNNNTSLSDIGRRIGQFVEKHKSILFFATSVGVALFTAPAAITYATMMGALIGGVMTAGATHVVSRILGVKGLAARISDDKVNILLGVTNIFARILNAPFGVGVAVYHAAVVGGSLAVYKFNQL